MKIALIWPKSPPFAKCRLPLGLGYLVSNMSPGHELKIIDCHLNNLDPTSPKFIETIQDFNPRVVGLSTDSMNYKDAVGFFSAVKSIIPEAITIIGGPHATCYPYKTMENQHLDFLMRGEGESSFPKFIEELEKPTPDWSKVPGLVYRTPDGSCKENEIQLEMNLDNIKIPDYDAMQLEEYLKRYHWEHNKRHTFIWTTRGCPYKCQFCSAPILNASRVRTHSIEYLVDWVKYLYYDKHINFINIIDDNFTYHTEFAKEFCQAMIDLGLSDLRFNTPNGIRAQRSDAELFRLMKKAGWQKVFIAPESGSTRTLRIMKKGIDLTRISDRMQEIRDAGLKVHGYFIVGYPGETVEDIRKTQSFIRENKFDYLHIGVFQPLPGTPIYNELVEKGEIPDTLLPTTYKFGEARYRTKDLKDFNFSGLIIGNYIHLFLKNPKIVFYWLTIYDLKDFIRSILIILKKWISFRFRRSSPLGESQRSKIGHLDARGLIK